MRCACLVVLIAGCGFTGGPAAPGGDPGSGDPGAGSGSGGGTTTGNTGSCDVTGPTLRLCVSFADNPMDLVVPPHTVAEATGILPIQGIINSIAGGFDLGTHLRFAESADFDVQDLTFDFWMSAGARPAGGKHEWMVDNNTQYFATYEDNGALRCGIGNTTVTSKVSIPMRTWHHVACTYSAADQQLRVYVDGNLSGCTDANPIPRGGMDGVAIGANYGAGGYKENLVGQLDMLHLYASALSPAEICSAANQTGCNATCPD